MYFAFSFLVSCLIFYFLIKLSFSLELGIDKNYNKDQAFHKNPKSNVGGLSIMISFFLFYFLNNENSLNFIIIFTILISFVGLLDDFDILTSSTIRFVLLISLIGIFIWNNDFYIQNFGYAYLDKIFANVGLLIVTGIALFLVINGSNLIDGFNGLLSLYILQVLFLILLLIIETNLSKYSNIIIFNLIFLIIFLYFNLYKQLIFLGDSGAYFLGSFLATFVIYIANNLKDISPFFFAIIVFYLYFETFFSVLRKIIERKNPFKPDNKHLHMLVFSFFESNGFKNSNNITGISINIFLFIYFIFSFYFRHMNDVSLILFINLHLIYLLIYWRLRAKK